MKVTRQELENQYHQMIGYEFFTEGELDSWIETQIYLGFMTKSGEDYETIKTDENKYGRSI